MTRLSVLAAAAVAAFAAFAAPLPAAADAPALRPHVIVEDGIVTLGDLFENAGAAAATAVFRAPDPGETGRVSAHRIAEAAARHGLEWDGGNGIDSISVARASTEVSLGDIREQIATAARARLVLPDTAGLSVELDPRAEPLHLPVQASGDIIVARLDLNRETGAFAAEVRASERDIGRTAIIFRGRAVQTVSVPVLVAPVTRGATIREGDIEMRDVPRRNVTPGTLVHRGDVVGMAARRSLNPGDTLREVELERPRLVEKNASVQLVFKSDTLTITTMGRALDDGAKGDAVRVLNLRTKRIVDGAVTARNTVVVSPIAQDKTALLAGAPVAR